MTFPHKGHTRKCRSRTDRSAEHGIDGRPSTYMDVEKGHYEIGTVSSGKFVGRNDVLGGPHEIAMTQRYTLGTIRGSISHRNRRRG